MLHNGANAFACLRMVYLSSKISSFSRRHSSTAMALMAVAGFAAGVATPKAAEAATHNWKFNYNNNLEADVILSYDGPFVPSTTFNITGISGTIGGFNITGLSTTFGPPSNQFQALSSSDVNVLTNTAGISFVTGEVLLVGPPLVYSKWNIFNNGSGFATANRYVTSSPSTSPSSGTLLVPGPPAPPQFSVVPGPLPIFGAAAAFGMSRRLRRRVLTSQLR